MPRELRIGSRVINDDSDCYVIAEIGHNHQGNVQTCRDLFKQAKECGASAVKLQKRDNPTMYTRQMFDQPYNSENAFAPTYGLHREYLEFGRDEYLELQAYAAELGIDFFSTAFDFASADFLEKLNIPLYKIASGDLTNIPLIKYIAEFGKPMIISTGGGTFEDIDRVYEAIAPINPRFCFLQCTAAYPADFGELNLRTIETYRARYPNTVVGWSAHDNGIAMAVAAYVLGARVIEKHFTLNRTMKGTDHAFSLEPVGLRKMVRDLTRTRVALGDGVKQRLESEQSGLLKMGKKLVAARDLPAGHVLTRDDIAIKSPGDGVPPYHLGFFIGKKLAAPLTEEDNLAFNLVKAAEPAAI